MKNTTKIALFSLSFVSLCVAGQAATATENWENLCASCHGEDGKAQTRQGKKLKIRDYTDPAFQAAFTDEQLLKAILDGVTVDGKERMKGYKDELEDPAKEGKELVDFIRKLKA